jgi:hypothetical protein
VQWTHFPDLCNKSLEKRWLLLLRATVVVVSAIRPRAQQLREQKSHVRRGVGRLRRQPPLATVAPRTKSATTRSISDMVVGLGGAEDLVNCYLVEPAASYLYGHAGWADGWRVWRPYAGAGTTNPARMCKLDDTRCSAFFAI